MIESIAGEGRDYQATLRCFPGGRCEVSVMATNHMARMAAARRWMGHDPKKMYVEEPTQDDIEKKHAENKARSIRRARQQVRWVCKTMQADHMITLTYRENMTDVERLKRDWKSFVKLVVARHPEWKYLAVREYQDRGALHLHIATHGYQDLKYLRKCWYKVLGASPNASGENTPGQVDVTGLKKRWGGKEYKPSADKIAAYLTKYLHKCFDEAEASSKRYWSSKGIEKPEIKKIWLGSTNYVDAIGEVYRLVHDHSGVVDLMWSSQGWQSIWMSG